MKSGAPFKLATVTALLCMLESTAVWADVIPGAAQPEQVGRALMQQQPVSTPKQKTPSPLGPEAEKIKFLLNDIILAGNHVYTKEQLRPLYASKLHTQVSVAELFEIVQGITNYYRNNGYIISRAILPPQHVKNGVVHVQITAVPARLVAQRVISK